MDEDRTPPPAFAKEPAAFVHERFMRTGQQALTVLLVVVVALFLWQIRNLLLIVFAGALLAIVLRAAARPLVRLTRLPDTVAVVIVALVLVLLLAAIGVAVGSRVTAQFGDLAQQLPSGLRNLLEQFLGAEAAEWVTLRLREADWSRLLGDGVFSSLTGAASVVLTVLLDLFLLAFLAVFLAINPQHYQRGLIRLLPPRYHARGRQVLDDLGTALSNWLLGTIVAMVVIGVFTAIGLLLLGVPLALVLGLIAGLFEFVPMLGPIAAAVPAVLVGFSEGATMALYVLLVMTAIQQVESNLVTPLIQRRAVSLPPALTLASTIGFGLVFGLLGVILAVPLLVVAVVLVKRLYVEDAMGESPEEP